VSGVSEFRLGRRRRGSTAPKALARGLAPAAAWDPRSAPVAAGVGPRLDVVMLSPVTGSSDVRGGVVVVVALPVEVVVVAVVDTVVDALGPLVEGTVVLGAGASLGSSPHPTIVMPAASKGARRRRITTFPFPIVMAGVPHPHSHRGTMSTGTR
jgi:hypothetical protein